MKKSILFLAVVLFFTACTSNSSTESTSDSTVVDSSLVDSTVSDSTSVIPSDSTLVESVAE